jgi:hypothetical protein
MKKTLLTTLFLSCAFAAYPQGQVVFNNRVTTAGTGAQTPITSLIYGVNPANPTRELHGQASTGVPAGAIDYTGHPLLAGTGFTAQLWGGPGGTAEGALALCTDGSTVFRTGGGAGIIVTLPTAASVPNAPAGPGSRATLQFRAWDNINGTITTWQQVLANPTIPRGASDLFTPAFDLGGGPVLPPNLIGLQSFNLHTVPEPSVIALGALGLGALLMRRFRKSS